MNVKNWLIGGFLAYWLLGKAGSAVANNVAWTFDKLRIKDIKLAKGGFDLRLRITNNLPTAIRLSSYQGEIFQNGSLLATIQNVTPIDLPPGKEIIVTAFAKVKALDLLKIRLDPVKVDSYAGFTIAGKEITLPITNTFHLFYVE